MSKKSGHKSWKTKKLILYMFFVLFLFLVYFVVNYFITVHIISNERKEINQVILKQISSNVETNVSDVERIASGIVEDLEYRRFVDSMSNEMPTFDAFKLQRRLQEESNKNHYINSISIYAPKSNNVLTNLEYVSAEYLFDVDWLEEYSTQKYLSHKQRIEFRYERNNPNLFVVRQFGGDRDKQAFVVISINPNLFKEAFNLEGIEDFMTVRITDSNNRVIYDTGDKHYFFQETFFDCFGNSEKKDFSNVKIGGKFYNAYYMCSNDLDLNFFILVPRFRMLLEYYPIVYFILIFAAVFLAAIYILLKRIERKTLLPVDNFVEGISSYVEGNNDISYDNLEGLYYAIIENDKSMKMQISSSSLALRWRMLMEILSGTKKDYDDFESQIKLLQMPMYSRNFVVMVIELERRKEMLFSGLEGDVSVYVDLIFRETENFGDDEGVKSASIKMQDDNVVCIISFLDDDVEKNIAKAMAYANILKSRFSAKTGEDISIGIGGYYVDFKNISDSYREAVIALERKFLFGKSSIISIEDVSFPVDADVSEIIKRIDLLKSVKVEQLDKIVCDIFDDIFRKNIDYEAFRMLAIQIISAIFDNKNVSDYKLDIMAGDIYSHINQFDVLQDAKDYILKIIEDIKNSIDIASKKDPSGERIIGEVLAYIHEHYANPELSLNMVSMKMGYNASHLSREFKKIKGTNFIDYLIEFRITKAKELLSNSKEKINDISKMVGYANANSFMRIFKRYTGITPSAYRISKKKSNKEY